MSSSPRSAEAGIDRRARSANVEHYELADEIGVRPVGLVAAGAERDDFARRGFAVLSF